ncbi:hypothetical protein Pan153_06810 [Gimesia panareensis]|uniref:Uncharacterized protein n=1 Tax=Gimesia panareensis TaxID=2527978 RepID=A0A518FIG2_9PLAN|nr:hypothetical protein [Gimesia panareensis]QDV16060.1 hypothetical protein Pan153_06810 [Gimesia panareensis]
MQLSFSTIARHRTFSRAMDRIDTRFQPLLDAFQTVKLEYPVHEAILVGITDDKPPQFFEEIETSDGFFQVFAGCSLRGGDQELVADVFEILRNATRLCPFAAPDHETLEALFKRLRPAVVGT